MGKRLWLSTCLGLASLTLAYPLLAAPDLQTQIAVRQIRAGRHTGAEGPENRIVFDLGASGPVRVSATGPQQWQITLPSRLSADAAAQLKQLPQQIPGLHARLANTGGFAAVVLQFDRPTRLMREFRLNASAAQPERYVLDFAAAAMAQPSSAQSASAAAESPIASQAASPVTPDASGPFAGLSTPVSAVVEPPAPAAPAVTASAAGIAGDQTSQLVLTAADGAQNQPDSRTKPTPTDTDITERQGARQAAKSATDEFTPEDIGSTSPLRISGFFEAEGRWFPQNSRDGVSEHIIGSIAGEPTIEYEWGGGNQLLRLTGFARVDTVTSNRTHADVREAKWVGVFGPLELTVGADRRFWGVIEAAHLVNIINQVDTLEDVDAEDYLGQPMVSAALSTKLGTFSGFFMPYFRERLFPDQKDRPNTPIRVERALTQYESDDERWHPDWAVRWSLKAGPVDLGLSHFSGTSREPRMLLMADSLGRPVLAPRYDLIDQTGIDLQATLGSWLFKFEGIQQWNPVNDYAAFGGGFEYTFYGVSAAGADLGVLVEYLYDERGKAGTSPFDDDVFFGLRWSGNDIATTELLAGAIFDLDTRSKAFILEGSRRLGGNWRISLDGRFFTSVSARDPLVLLGDDDFFQLKLQYHF